MASFFEVFKIVIW